MSWCPNQDPIGKSKQTIGAVQASTILPNPNKPLLLCLSHLRWNFVYQRPQHLMSRFAKHYEVLFFEEPCASQSASARLAVKMTEEGVRVLTPYIPKADLEANRAVKIQRQLLDRYLSLTQVDPVLWYYTPMSMAFTDHVRASLIVYDCMDELSAFRGAPPQLLEYEKRLLDRADLVFTGGYSLYDAKRKHHANTHPFPSSVDIAHFKAARRVTEQAEDQAAISGPRLGFYGVIDERLDLELIDAVAAARPEWQIIMIGPVAKINPDELPQRPNIHYLGPKVYDELPQYLGGWDVALMPFAINEATRYISPTKTPEYLAGGRPVVSTPIRDVVNSYGDTGLVHIASDSASFIQAVETALASMQQPEQVAHMADLILMGMSWDDTVLRMGNIMEKAIDTAQSQALEYFPGQYAERPTMSSRV